MIKNYLKIALRNLFKNKVYSFINIFGLAVGIACCVLIGIYISYQLSYDRYFKHADSIYRIAWWSGNPQTRTPYPMAQAMVRDFPEVETATSISPIWGPGLTRPVFSVRYKDKRFDEKGFFSADSTFFDVFSFKLVYGDKKNALTQPGGIVITQKIAHKYFGNVNPLGKTLRVNDRFDFAVTGVIQNIPDNTHFHFDFLISYVTLEPRETGEYYTWADFGHYNYIRLKSGTDAKQLQDKMQDWSAKYINWTDAQWKELKRKNIEFRLQPLTKIHLYSNLRWELEPGGNRVYIYIFAGAALFILIIACVNFMNLTMARSLLRAKEVGMRKTVGASRTQLIAQFLTEAVLICGFAVLLAIGLLELILPTFNHFAGIDGVLSFYNWKLPAGLFAGTLLLGIASGGYPAFMLSKLEPVRVLKGVFTTSKEGTWLKKGLVEVQFTVSVILIAGTLIIYKQLNFINHKNLGFDGEQVVVVPIKSGAVRDQYDALKSKLSGISGVQQVSAVSNLPGGSFNQNPVQWRADDPQIDVSEFKADYNFAKALGIKIVGGRGFSKARAEDDAKTVLLNQTAARAFGWDSAINKVITYFDDGDTLKVKVVGVVKDFNFQSLHQAIAPLMIQVQPWAFNYVLIKLKPTDVSQQLASIKKAWKQFDPMFDFQYSFLNSDFEAYYRKEQKAGSVLFLFSGLAIIIACMGLFGLTSFAVQRRIKEIGIRKVLGASVTNIVALLSKDFVKLVLIGFVIAIPIAWYVMNRWLADFAYKIEIGPGIFVLAGATSLLIALLTVSWQSIKAAVANPVESLKSE